MKLARCPLSHYTKEKKKKKKRIKKKRQKKKEYVHTPQAEQSRIKNTFKRR